MIGINDGLNDMKQVQKMTIQGPVKWARLNRQDERDGRMHYDKAYQFMFGHDVESRKTMRRKMKEISMSFDVVVRNEMKP